MTRADRRLLAPPASARRRLAGARRRATVRAVCCSTAGARLRDGAGARAGRRRFRALRHRASAHAVGRRLEDAASPAVVTLAGAPQPPTAATSSGEPAAEVDVPLSNDRDETTWAHPAEVLPIYVHPSVHAREITHTHIVTEDGFPEVYELLDSRVDAAGHRWIKLRVPGRPNGRVGWVLREALGGLHRTRWRVRINLALRRLTAYYEDRRRFVAPVGVGTPSTPTPTGHFWVRERFRVSDRSSPYYPWAIGTSAYSVLSDWPGGGIVGIHGPYGEPWRIPGDPSHGCVRMRDGDLARLAPMVTLGTPVDIV